MSETERLDCFHEDLDLLRVVADHVGRLKPGIGSIADSSSSDREHSEERLRATIHTG